VHVPRGGRGRAGQGRGRRRRCRCRQAGAGRRWGGAAGRSGRRALHHGQGTAVQLDREGVFAQLGAVLRVRTGAIRGQGDSAGGSPRRLVYKTVLATFAAHGSSVISLLS
jgi:hypothetical protein